MSADILPVDWNGPVHGLRIAITPIDEFNMPIERRGISATLPTKPHEFDKFADDIAESVRNTVIYILTGKTPEVPDADQ